MIRTALPGRPRGLGRVIAGVDDRDTYVCRPDLGMAGEIVIDGAQDGERRADGPVLAPACDRVVLEPDLSRLGAVAAEIGRPRRELRAAIGRAIRKGGVHTGELVAARRGGICPRCCELSHATVGARSTPWRPSCQA